MGQIKFMVSMLMIALFGLALITFAINFAVDNNTRISAGDDDEFTAIKTSVESDINVFYEDANTSTEAIGKTTISTQTEATEGGTAFKVGPWTAIKMARTMLSSSYTKIFGADSGFGFVITAVLGMLGIIMGFYIYKTLAGRNPD